MKLVACMEENFNESEFADFPQEGVEFIHKSLSSI